MSQEFTEVAEGYRAGETSSDELRQGFPGRRPARLPILQTDDLDPDKYARTTCFAAGYLTAKNAGWRNSRPVVNHAKCTGCLQCYMYCPDGAIFKIDNDPASDASVNKTDTSVEIDLDFCKGCGICAFECKFDSIDMVNEGEARKAEEGEGE